VKGRVLRLEESSWPHVAKLELSKTAVFLLSGPMEQHGPHLPMGTDLFQAGRVMETIIERVAGEGWNILIAPTLPYTTAVLSRNYPGSVSIRQAHLTPFFTDLLNSFAGNGLRNIVVVSQHIDPPHVLAWESACRQAAEATGARAIEGYERLLFDDMGDPAWQGLLGKRAEGNSHAGLFETSVVLLARPELVDREVARGLEPMPLPFEEMRSARDFRQLGNGLGYTGRPGDADPELGRKLVERYATRYGDIVLDHLRGGEVWERLTVRPLFSP
jgi:creatinine amidohydrolase